MFYRILSISLLTLILGGSALLGGLFYVSEEPWVDFSVLEHYNPGKPSILLDDEGKEWGRFELDKREIRKLSQMPKALVNAFIAAEDWTFFSHGGISCKGIIRSMWVNLTHLKKAQGASTITQQLVRLLFFEREKSFSRKIQEQILALVIEKQFTKEQILETYLNHIYLGAGIYGVEAACQRFWGKSVTDCTLDEAAVLASIVRYPRLYCPLYNPSASLQRRNLVLKNMRNLGFISKHEYQEAITKPVISLARQKTGPLGSHLKETIRLFLEETYGKKQVYTGGMQIQTTLNSAMQKAAETVFKAQMEKLHTTFSDKLEGALVCIDGKSGGIKALVGGYNFSVSQFNRAVSAQRQMGSTFKPLIFAQALMKGKTFADIDVDEPITLMQGNQEWTPGNAAHKFMGPMTLAYALSRSNNIVSIKTFLSSGPEEIAQLARDCNLTPGHAYPSLALGCLESTPVQAAAMMNIFAHKGQFAEPYSLVWVKDEWGTKLFKGTIKRKQVLRPLISDQVAKILMLSIEQARTKYPQLYFSCDALGKSGTTNDARTCWFVGSTPQYTTSIYIGFDNNKSLGKGVFAAQTAFPIWREFNRSIKQPVETFSFDQELEARTIDALTGKSSDLTNPDAVTILIPRS